VVVGVVLVVIIIKENLLDALKDTLIWTARTCINTSGQTET
jgi:hypothetical protein